MPAAACGRAFCRMQFGDTADCKSALPGRDGAAQDSSMTIIFGTAKSLFTGYKQLLAMPEVDMIAVGAPNDVHCQITLDAAVAGKHVVMEKPLCLNLADAD